MSDRALDAHLREDDEHWIPERTTPQGTQEYAVERGYERRDIHPRPLGAWLAGLAVFALVVHLILWGAFIAMRAWQERMDDIPSPLFTQQPELPPGAPPLLPSPQVARRQPRDAQGRLLEPLQGPIEYHKEQQRLESEALAQIGLLDPNTGQMRIPPEIAQRVAASMAPPAGTAAPAPGPETIRIEGQRLEYLFPSDSSGGTFPENRLQ